MLTFFGVKVFWSEQFIGGDMGVLAAIIERKFETHIDDVLVLDQVVAFPDGDHSDRYVVGQFSRDDGIIVLRRYFPVQAGNTKRVSMAGDEFIVYGFSVEGPDTDPHLVLEDSPSMVIPIASPTGEPSPVEKES